MNIKKIIAVVWAVAEMFQALAETPMVSDVSARQRYPWNGKVDISFTLSGGDAYVSLEARDVIGGTNVAMRSVYEENTGVQFSFDSYRAPGEYHCVWDAGRDLPDESFFSNMRIRASSNRRYMVVDLSGGTSSSSFQVTYLDEIPTGGWSSEYKQTKLVLRYIPQGEFNMGSNENELGRGETETLHPVVITTPFYIGVFEVTQKQYSLIWGSNPSYRVGDARPVEQVSYDMVRGSGKGSHWPESNEIDDGSFLGRLNSKTKVRFDLPTEAQWEYACRAGTSTALNNGKNLTNVEECPNLNQLGRYAYNVAQGAGGYSEFHTTVGSYKPNNWGLYDMHGNIWEYCLDWLGTYPTGSVIDPLGSHTGVYRVVRGGRYSSPARLCRSAYRGGAAPNETHAETNSKSQYGLRLACVIKD